MDDAEGGKGGTLLQEACDMLKTIALQAWTQPLRHDETDGNVVSISRFRNHVWWVGGNALAYRSLLPVAAMYRSIPMIDLLAEVCQRGISMTSQTTGIFMNADRTAILPDKLYLLGDAVYTGTGGSLRLLAYRHEVMSGEAYEALQDKDANTLYLIYEED